MFGLFSSAKGLVHTRDTEAVAGSLSVATGRTREVNEV